MHRQIGADAGAAVEHTRKHRARHIEPFGRAGYIEAEPTANFLKQQFAGVRMIFHDHTLFAPSPEMTS
ncbi:hypothetical protein BURCENBC7_AP7012 [Burkholderia cenocepacia BC7]|nr:hypothetical protein BURCENBC7_AP7012 [Burkholderia cenocepacia BC7]